MAPWWRSPIFDPEPRLHYASQREYFTERYRHRGLRFIYWDQLTFVQWVSHLPDREAVKKTPVEELRKAWSVVQQNQHYYRDQRREAKRRIRKLIREGEGQWPLSRRLLAYKARLYEIEKARYEAEDDARRERERVKAAIRNAQKRAGTYRPDNKYVKKYTEETALRRSRIDWLALVPPDIAGQQLRWERMKTLAAMRAVGLPYPEIGRRFGLSRNMVWVYFKRYERLDERHKRQSPIERYFEGEDGGLRSAVAEIRQKYEARRSRIEGRPHGQFTAYQWSVWELSRPLPLTAMG